MIVSATILSLEPQAGGRTWVREAQTDDVHGILIFTYLLEPGDSYAVIMAARTAAINAALNALGSATVTGDDGATATVRWDGGSVDLRLTSAQKTALQNAKTVIDTVRPFVVLYYSLTAAQQQWVLTHSPWFAQVLAVLNGS